MVRMRTISNQSRHDERETRTDISQVELQLHRLPDAPRRGLHQLRREDRCAADGLQFFSDTGSIGKSDPSQLIEFNLGALQLIAGRSVPNALDTSNVDFDVSYVNVAFGPAAMAPFQNDQSGYVGTPQTGETFETALKNFLGIGSVPNPNAPGVGWPQFVHTSSLNGSKSYKRKLVTA
jgi:hypothetical protein